jgi:hypothetical protein
VNDLTLPEFQRAIEAIHDVRSRFLRQVHVRDDSTQPAWEGDVLVFSLLNHPRSHRCYAWEIDGEVTVILEDDQVKSAEDAVRAALGRL